MNGIGLSPQGASRDACALAGYHLWLRPMGQLGRPVQRPGRDAPNVLEAVTKPGRSGRLGLGFARAFKQRFFDQREHQFGLVLADAEVRGEAQ